MPKGEITADISDNPAVGKLLFAFVCLVFIGIIVVPAIYVCFEMFARWSDVKLVYGDPELLGYVAGAVFNSFSIAFIVSVIDIIVGLPMAWIMVRKTFRGKRFLDTLMDMPLAFPTAVLGMSVVMFWGAPEGVTIQGLGLHISPYVMVILLHIIFTFPYMVRSLSAILEQIDLNYETAGRTLGAPAWTAVRTITLPLFRAGFVTGFILCFARSLSETGGTMIALNMMGVDSFFFTGPTFISFMKRGDSIPPEGYGAMILVSVIMILLALLLLFAVRRISRGLNLPESRIFVGFERKISRNAVPKDTDVISVVFLFVIVLIPSFYIFMYLTEIPESIDWAPFFKSMGTSFLIAGIAVAVNILMGISMAMYIARNKESKLGSALDTLVNIPLIIPTTALGFSLSLFWAMAAPGWPSLILVILGHISFTYPLVVRNMVGAIEETDPSYEEIARTLGASRFRSFREVLLPIIKPSVAAGAILAFTRSLGETGATQAIAGTDVVTVPVFLVNMVNSGNFAEAALCSMILIAVCFVLTFGVRYFLAGGEKNA